MLMMRKLRGSFLKSRRTHDSEGFTLVEVLVAVTMIGALVAAMAALLMQAVAAQNRLTAQRAANNLMQSEVTNAESMPWDDVMLNLTGTNSLCDLTGSSLRSSSQAVTPANAYAIDGVEIGVARNVQWLASQDQVTCSNVPNDRQDIKVVTITLTWYPDGINPTTRSQTLYLSKAREPVKART